MDERRKWSRDELLVAFSLYCRLPFGQFDQRNAEVQRVAAALGRTPGALAMRLSNFASLDPIQQARGIRGLSSTGPGLQAFWNEVHADWNRTAVETEVAWQRLPGAEPAFPVPARASEATREVRVRLVQGFFRQTVLASYEERCAVCGIRPGTLLTASHIIPWAENEQRRADPTNGLCLCALHDRAFDRGLITLDEGLRVLVSSRLKLADPTPIHREALLAIEGDELQRPSRFAPDEAALAWHRERLFVA